MPTIIKGLQQAVPRTELGFSEHFIVVSSGEPGPLYS